MAVRSSQRPQGIEPAPRHTCCDCRAVSVRPAAALLTLLGCVLVSACASEPLRADANPEARGGEAGDGPASAAPSTGQITPALSAACEHVANTWCQRLAECSPLELYDFYGAGASCQAATKDECETRLTMAGVNSDPQGPNAIATQLEGMRCYQISSWIWFVDYSDLPGLNPEGAACRFDMQCASLFCDTPPDASCGTCSALPNVEEHVDEPCYVGQGFYTCVTPGLTCQLSTETCVLPPKLGEPCIDDGPGLTSAWDLCAGTGLECHAGVCVEPLAYGEPCTQQDDRCSLQAGLSCGADSLCAIAGPPHLQGECGPFSEGPGTCGYLDICTYEDPNGNNDAPGDCQPRREIGFGDTCSEQGPFARCPFAMSCLDGTCQTSLWLATCK